MDIDRNEEVSGGVGSILYRRIVAPVDDRHPFDLESYVSNYAGKPRLILSRRSDKSTSK
jgi:hypothetical protein